MKNGCQKWRLTGRPARLWEKLAEKRTKCLLCPRNCICSESKTGFCGVRQNDGGNLITLNYGKSVPMTQEYIEVEAVYNYAPGEPILSLGNIGCMMNCDFCQNWSTSQAHLVRDQDVVEYTPEEVVDYALSQGLRVLSWTYNDPVVWHEFVLETARLARAKGLKNVYKSAFYISEKAVSELLPVMDVFSISLKALDADFYRQVTKGELQAVLNGILQVNEARKNGGPHLEISNLCVTGRNDTLEAAKKVSDWMLKNLDEEVPLHYVRFHPDYLYTNVERTSVNFLEEARIMALKAGHKYVYVGNVNGSPGAHTYCHACGHRLISRFGWSVECELEADNACPSCGAKAAVIRPWPSGPKPETLPPPDNFIKKTHFFRGPIQSCHVESKGEQPVYYRFLDAEKQPLGVWLQNGCRRFIVAGSSPEVNEVVFYHHPGQPLKVFEVYDRAHFPVLEAEATCGASPDRPPAPAGEPFCETEKACCKVAV